VADTEFKQIIVPVMFILFFSLLAGSIPSAMFVTETEGYQVNVPEYFRGLDVGSYATTHNFTVDDATFDLYTYQFQHYDYDIGNRYYRATTNIYRGQLQIGIRTYVLIFLFSVDYLRWRSPEGLDRGTDLTGSEMNLDYSEDENWIKYRLSLDSDPTVGFDALIGFNNSLYSSPKEALEADALTVFIGFGIDDLYTSLNVWAIMGEVMTFRNPDIPFPLNLVIPSLIWVMFGYAMLIIVTKLIPGLG
jgi:hypothetical protein